MVLKQWKIFCASLLFFSRIPARLREEQVDEYFRHSIRYLPLVGIIISSLAAAVMYLVLQLLSLELAIIAYFVTSALLTGGLHEDGFADSCDGFGGGWNKEQVLSIMKDSRVGTYGVLGLIFLFFTKFFLLIEIPVAFLPLSLISAAALSRAVTVLAAYKLEYATLQNAKSSSVSQFTLPDLLVALLFGLLPLFFFPAGNLLWIVLALAMPLLSAFLLRLYMQRKIGGYTGDSLGAVQQLSEVSFYVALALSWKFT
jgi:adenosylcobinamide-GDP ribazoletransferase